VALEFDEPFPEAIEDNDVVVLSIDWDGGHRHLGRVVKLDPVLGRLHLMFLKPERGFDPRWAAAVDQALVASAG
jgi:hypothetical protein